MSVILKGWWKVVLIAVLLVGMGAILPLNAQADPAPPVVDEWHIPTILFLSGAYAHIGEMMKFSQDEGVKDINSTGGIRGKPLVIDWHDSATDAMKAVAEMSKVVEDALVIIGPNYAPAAAAALPLATRNKVFCLPYTAGTQIVIQFRPWTAGMVPDYNDFGLPVKGWAKLNPGMKSVAQFIWKADQTWVEIAKYHTKALNEVGIEVKNVEVSEGIDMGAATVKALSYKPDGFVIVVGAMEAAKIVKELDKRGVKDKGRILIFVTADFPDLYIVGEGYLEGVTIYNALDPYSDSPRWQSLLQRFQTAYPDIADPPSWALAWPYDMVYMVKAALENQEITGDPSKLAEERVKIRDYINNMKDFAGVNDTFSMIDGLPKIPWYLFEIKNNKKVFLERYEP